MVARDWLSRRMILLGCIGSATIEYLIRSLSHGLLLTYPKGFERNGTRGTRFLSR